MNDIFAAMSPDLYDLSLPRVVPGLSDARMARAAVFRFLTGDRSDWLGAEIGIGTGSDVVTFLPKNSSGVLYGIDGSIRLTDKLRRTGRLPSEELEQVQVNIVLGDIGDTALPAGIPDHCFGCFDFVNSAFTIHNLPRDRQANAFRHVSTLLKKGGCFLYMDLVDFHDSRLVSLAHRIDIEFIEQEMATTPIDIKKSDWANLRRGWKEHYEEENFLLPPNGAVEPNVAALFEQAGLSAPETLYRNFHTTLLVATKL